MNKNLIYLIISLILTISNDAHAQALHWLSQPDQSPGMVINGNTGLASISANGQYVAFFSSASNIVAGDNNQRTDLFLYDTVNETNERFDFFVIGDIETLSKPSSDGRYISFISKDGNFSSDPSYLYLFDTQTNQLTFENNNNGAFFNLSAFHVHLSDTADELIFSTNAQLRAEHDDGLFKIYKKDLNTGEFSIISLSSDGSQLVNSFATALGTSDNGRYVLVNTNATNTISNITLNSGRNLMVLDRDTGQYNLVTVKPDGSSSEDPSYRIRSVSVSNSGQVVYNSNVDDVVDDDNNNREDVFYFDGSRNTRINLDENGQETFGGFSRVLISADDAFIIFSNSAILIDNDENFRADTFIYDINDGNLARISSNASGAAGNGSTIPYSISTDGKSLIVTSRATDLIAGNNQIELERLYHYSIDDQSFTQQIPAVISSVETTIAGISASRISANQRFATYFSNSPYLSLDINSGERDLFLLDRDTGEHRIIGRRANASVLSYDFSEGGRYVVFTSRYFQPLGMIQLPNEEMVLYDRIMDTYIQIGPGFEPSVNNAGMVVFTTNVDLVPEDNNGFRDVYLFDPSDNSFSLVSRDLDGQGGGGGNANITDAADNIWIGFTGNSSNFIENDNNGWEDLFIINWPNGLPIRVSQRVDGTGGDDFTIFKPNLSENADFVTFLSFAHNLTDDDYTGANRTPAFLYERATQNITVISKDDNDQVFDSNTSVGLPEISASGRYISYTANGELNFLNDFNPGIDVFLYDTQTQQTQIISQTLNGFQFDGNNRIAKVVENLDVTPPLVEVIFDGIGRYSSINNHPGHTESYLYQQGGPNVILNIEINGQGQVAGTFAINCSTTCDFDFALGTALNLIATPANGFIFDGWDSQFGQCDDDSNPCSIDMNRDIILKVNFIDQQEIIFSNGFE